jgi:hypothetical protein
MNRKRECQFVDDSKGRLERFWFCTVHHTRVTDPLKACLFSRYDGCPRFAHCHAVFQRKRSKP